MHLNLHGKLINFLILLSTYFMYLSLIRCCNASVACGFFSPPNCRLLFGFWRHMLLKGAASVECTTEGSEPIALSFTNIMDQSFELSVDNHYNTFHITSIKPKIILLHYTCY